MGIDTFKLEALKHISGLPSFSKSWPNYSIGINHHLGSTPDGNDLFNLGDHLSDCFQGNTPAGRSQSQLSTGGTAWECLVVWYLNVIFWNTNVFVTKSVKKFIPEVIRDSIACNISNISTNTESDILAYTIPESLMHVNDPTIEDINEEISSDIHNQDLVVVQTKTNWNDNSQIPMLWDIVYNSGSKPISNVTVGKNGVNPGSFRRFAYSFITVPTTKIPKPTSIHTHRVQHLSGGNFFGRPTTPGVAQSIKEFAGHNFPSVAQIGIPNHLNSNLDKDPYFIGRFLGLGF